MATVIELDGKTPQVADDAFIAPTAVLIGDVTVGAGAFVYGVLKGAVLTVKEILEGLGSLVGTVIKTFRKSFGEILDDVHGLYKEIAGIDIRGTMGTFS